jgi:hypothetical protein
MNQRSIVWISGLLFVTSVGSLAYTISWEHDVHSSLAFATVTLAFGGSGAVGVFGSVFGFVSVGATFLSNLFSSCVIGYKAW